MGWTREQMINFLKAIFAWEKVFESGAYAYYENAITGKRRAVKNHYGWSPVDTDWLNKTKTPLNPPFGGSGMLK